MPEDYQTPRRNRFIPRMQPGAIPSQGSPPVLRPFMQHMMGKIPGMNPQGSAPAPQSMADVVGSREWSQRVRGMRDGGMQPSSEEEAMQMEMPQQASPMGYPNAGPQQPQQTDQGFVKKMLRGLFLGGATGGGLPGG